jgi:ribosomal protein S18 acetylase RimI-like enzyme
MDDIIIRRAVASDAVDAEPCAGAVVCRHGRPTPGRGWRYRAFLLWAGTGLPCASGRGTDGSIVGAAAYSPFFSTVYGGAGVYVSDLWVDAQTRGKRLGQRLLAAVRDEGIRMWDARLMRLNVYHDNPKALAFYERIGFVAVSDAQYLTLSGAAFETLGEQA